MTRLRKSTRGGERGIKVDKGETSMGKQQEKRTNGQVQRKWVAGHCTCLSDHDGLSHIVTEPYFCHLCGCTFYSERVHELKPTSSQTGQQVGKRPKYQQLE